MPQDAADQDQRLAGAPPCREEPGSTGLQHMPAIEFEDLPPPALPPKRPL